MINIKLSSTANSVLQQELQHKIDNKTKPIGALGELERIALQIGLVQNTVNPNIHNPTIITFAGDHGIAALGEVNPYPQEVTAQMVYNFLNNGAAINVFCNLHGIQHKIVDAGVNHDFDNIDGLTDAKIAYGTHNYQNQPAMHLDNCLKAIEKGIEIANELDSNCIGFGEMGIGNTSAASLLMAYFTGINIIECVGSGTGLAHKRIQKKVTILSDVYTKYNPKTPLEALATFGGYEIAMIVGSLLQAAALKKTIIIDGFIVTASLLVAHSLEPTILDYCIFAHTSGEKGHQKMLEFLDKKPLLNLGLRLGEGTGAALAFPIIKAAVAFINEMASFKSAGVSNQ